MVYDRAMVLVAVDDLLFSSKIRATAKQAGVELTFARSPEEIIGQARATKPALVIFDLNSAQDRSHQHHLGAEGGPGARRDPRDRLRLARAHRAHRGGAEGGRRPGPPRSAFAGNLAEILLSAQSPTPDHQDRTSKLRRGASRRTSCARRCGDREWLSAASRRRRLDQARRHPDDLLVQGPRRAERGVAAAASGGIGRPALVTASAGNHGRGLAFAASIARAAADRLRAGRRAARQARGDARGGRGADSLSRLRRGRGAREGTWRAGDRDCTCRPTRTPTSSRAPERSALEILEQDPGVEVIVCPVGGGGLISGTAIAAGPAVATWGVETESSSPFTQGLAAGQRRADRRVAESGGRARRQPRSGNDHFRPGPPARRRHRHGDRGGDRRRDRRSWWPRSV